MFRRLAQDRRLLGLGLVLAIVLLLAAAWWWSAGARPGAPRTAAQPEPWQGEMAPPIAPPTKRVVIRQDEKLPERVEQYLADNEYPPDSGELQANAQDLLEPYRRYESFMGVPGTQASNPPLTFLWTADRYLYTSDQVAVARFEARTGDGPARIRELTAWARAEGREGALGTPVALLFAPESEAPGAAQLAELDLARRLADHHGPVALTVRYGLEQVAPVEQTIRIYVTPAGDIPATFSGRFSDRVDAGSLVVDAGIEVEEPGFYRIDANLIDRAGNPIAWATFKGPLETRDTQVPLRFFGKVLRDRGTPGPYTLRSLRGYLFRDAQFPDKLHMRGHEAEWRTAAWQPDDFSDAVWDSAHKQRMVELMLEDVQRGISLDAPPVATQATAGAPGD